MKTKLFLIIFLVAFLVGPAIAQVTLEIDGKAISKGTVKITTETVPTPTPTPIQYTISTNVITPAGGTISPTSRIVNQDGTATFAVTINSGYTASVVEGVLSGTVWTIQNVSSNHTATITFTKLVVSGRPTGAFPSLGPFGPYPSNQEELKNVLAEVVNNLASNLYVWAQWVKNNPADLSWVWDQCVKSNSQVITPAPTPVSTWTKVASEGERFTVSGTKTVRYGAETNWIEKVVTGTCQCTNTFFGKDPISGTVKSCEVSSKTPTESVPVLDPTPIPPAPTGWTPITDYIAGTPNVGVASTLVVGQVAQYSFLLLDELPLISNATTYRNALIKGQNYSKFIVYLASTNSDATFELKLITPDGTVVVGSLGDLLWTAFIQNAVPGRYKISCKLLSLVSGTSAFYRVVTSPIPPIMPSELVGK